jgi:hypothetical protein
LELFPHSNPPLPIAIMRGIAATLLSAAIAAQTVLAGPIRARTPYAVKESHHVPREWTKLDRASGDHVIHLQIGLKQGKFDELERHLYEGEYIDKHSLEAAHRIPKTSDGPILELGMNPTSNTQLTDLRSL